MSYSKHGGARIGAGRPKKPACERGLSHARRPEWSGPEPLHVTLRVLDHVYNLRTRRCFEIVSAALLAACNQLGFRICAFSLQGNHLHLLVEAACATALSHGVRRLVVRLALGLNRLMGRHGPVFERFHARRLRTPREVRSAFAYILGNTAKHAAQVGRPLPDGYRDPYTAGYFGSRTVLPPGTERLVAEPETWLLRDGWRRGVATEADDTCASSRPSRVSAPVADLLSRVAGVPRPELRPGETSEHRDRATHDLLVA